MECKASVSARTLRYPKQVYQTRATPWEYPIHELDYLEGESAISGEFESLRDELVRKNATILQLNKRIADLRVCFFPH